MQHNSTNHHPNVPFVHVHILLYILHAASDFLKGIQKIKVSRGPLLSEIFSNHFQIINCHFE